MAVEVANALLIKDAQFADVLRDIICHGGQVPIEQALWSRLHSPLIGDKVIERSFSFPRTGDALSCYGELVDRVFNLNLDTEPASQPYSWHLWKIRRIDNGEELIWDNCDFVVAMTIEEYRSFVDDDRFDALDRATWWWESAAKQQEAKILARSSSGESLALWSAHQAKLQQEGDA